MKSVLISISPKWVFLIIAREMGWRIDNEKLIEVRKNFPKSEKWNRVVEIYCSKNKRSFDEIPKEYQPLMRRFLGKVVGKFICNRIDEYTNGIPPFYELSDGYNVYAPELEKMCLSYKYLDSYGQGKPLYGWYISKLQIYEKLKELNELIPFCDYIGERCDVCLSYEEVFGGCCRSLKRAPQNWCYIAGGIV